MPDRDLVKFAAEATDANGRYAYTLADLLHTIRASDADSRGLLPLATVHEVSLLFGKYRREHQESRLVVRGGT